MSRTGTIRRCDSRVQHPDLHHAKHLQTVEDGVRHLLAALVLATTPRVVLELGSYIGITAEAMGTALLQVGHGHLHTIERDKARAEKAAARTRDLPVTVHATGYTPALVAAWAPYDLVFIDANPRKRTAELAMVAPHLAPWALVAMHDTGDDSEGHDAAQQLLRDQGWRAVEIICPRGLLLLQKEPK